MPFAKASFAISTFKPASSWCTILISHAFLPGTVIQKNRVKVNILKTGPMTELEKLPVHGLKVEPMVEPRLNRIKPGRKGYRSTVSIESGF